MPFMFEWTTSTYVNDFFSANVKNYLKDLFVYLLCERFFGKTIFPYIFLLPIKVPAFAMTIVPSTTFCELYPFILL